ncbi:MAG: lipopolysaccharide transport periplasmic protein LptA [Desulfurivibrio sp.]|nr:lipopolysaccharide transport periplasmic protein LptA [Desulfurivibrio sp.]
MRTTFFLIFLSVSLMLATGAAATPIEIEADRMESMTGENAILFTGQVVAHQEGLTVHSDKMTVHYFSDEERARQAADDERRLKKLFATGNVRVESDDFSGSGQRLDYFEVERKAILSGKAKVWQDNNLVTGDRVTMYLDEGKSIVEDQGKSEQRVRAYFYSEEDGDQQEGDAEDSAPPSRPEPAPQEQPRP